MFRNCTSLKTIEFPETVTTIQYNAFYGCAALESFTFAGESSLNIQTAAENVEKFPQKKH